MSERGDSGKSHSRDVAVCVQSLNRTIGELARCYGTASVAAALTEVMGCSACAADSVERGAGIHALVERISSVH